MFKLLDRVKNTLKGKWQVEFDNLAEEYEGKNVDVLKGFDLPLNLNEKVKGNEIFFEVPAVKIAEVATGVRFGGLTARIKLVKGIYARFGDLDVGRKTTLMAVGQGMLKYYTKGIFFDDNEGNNEDFLEKNIAKITTSPDKTSVIMIERWKGKPITFQLPNLTPKQAFGLMAVNGSYPKG